MRQPPVDPPTQDWASRAEMMQARRSALRRLERAAWLDWTRPLLGAVALALLLVGQLGAGLTLSVADFSDPGEARTAWAVVAVGSVLAVVGAWLGIRVWRAGRAVVDALVAWEELTDRVPADGSHVRHEDREIQDASSEDERRLIVQRNWVYFRARTFQFSQMPRIALAVVLMLPGAAVVVGVVRSLLRGEGFPDQIVPAVLPAITVLVFGAVLFGGIQRFGNAIFRRHRTMRRIVRAQRQEKVERQRRWRDAWEE